MAFTIRRLLADVLTLATLALSSRARLAAEMRSGTMSVMRALLRQSGYRLPAGSPESAPARLARLPLPVALGDTIAPLRRTLKTLSEEIAALDAQCDALAAQDIEEVLDRPPQRGRRRSALSAVLFVLGRKIEKTLFRTPRWSPGTQG